MTQYSAQNGVAGDWRLMHIGKFAVGGTSMVFTESTYVEPHVRNHPDCLALYTTEQVEGLSRVVQFVHKNSDAKFCIQLCHAGRKAAHKPLWDGGGPLEGDDRFQTYAPSAIPLTDGYPVPKEMTNMQILQAIENFQKAVRNALRANVDCVELHSANGYVAPIPVALVQSTHRQLRWLLTKSNALRTRFVRSCSVDLA